MANATEKISLLCTCGRMRRAARLASRMYDERLKAAGLNVGQWAVLSWLKPSDGYSMGELAEALAMDRTTLTRNLKPLQRDALVESERGSDRRTSVIRITAKGVAAWERALPFWKKAQTELASLMGSDMQTQLHTSLDHAIVEMERHARG